MNLTTYWQCARCQTKHEIMTMKNATKNYAMITISPHYIVEVFTTQACKVCSYPMRESLLVAALVSPEPIMIDGELLTPQDKAEIQAERDRLAINAETRRLKSEQDHEQYLRKLHE